MPLIGSNSFGITLDSGSNLVPNPAKGMIACVTIRAIAKQEISSGNFYKVVSKEFVIGILNGIIFAIISAGVVQFWFKEFDLSILIAVAMILNMIVAGLFGILVPVSLKKFNIDPALASSVFVTTITDVIGFLSFLGIGSFFFLN